MANHPAIFLDRDGTIIKDNGYINHLQEVEFFPYSFKALQNLQEHFLLIIITNQSGVSKGLISENEVREINRHIVETLRTRGITIFDVFYCPHKSEENCECKKPKPYFIHHAAGLYNIDLNRSFMVGDHPSDVQCGINAGIAPIYLLSGHGNKHRKELNADVKLCKDLSEASKYILSVYKSNSVVAV